MTAVIREASLTDRDRLVSFHHALYVDHRNAIMNPALAQFYGYRDLPRALREDVSAILRNPDAHAFVAEVAEVPVGYITGHVEEDGRRMLPKKGVVEDWYVEQEHRGAGIGRQLLETLTSAFRAEGCQVLESATWPFNRGARAAHDALGFHEVEIRYRKRL
jgi:phosphinothricin acetyltransferase